MKHCFMTSLILMSMMAIVSCSEVNESSVTNSEGIDTRSQNMESPYTIPEDDVVKIVSDRLGNRLVLRGGYNGEYVLSSDNSDKFFPSDTIAYVVNFDNNSGYAVLANDIRISSLIAYSKSGHLEVKDGKISDRILNYLESTIRNERVRITRASDLPCYEGGGCTGHYHCHLRPTMYRIVHEGMPFNMEVEKLHPGCNAGTLPAAIAIILSHTRDELIYGNYKYHFPSINYCLEQGPDFNPIVTDVAQPLGWGIFPMEFQYSYDGAVGAMATLMKDLGKDMGTEYNANNSVTTFTKAYEIFQKIGHPVEDFDIHSADLWRYMLKGYYIIMNAYDYVNNKEVCFILDGGEALYTESPEDPGSGIAIVYLPTEDTFSDERMFMSLGSLDLRGFKVKAGFAVEKLNK